MGALVWRVLVFFSIGSFCAAVLAAEQAAFPQYKPSSRSPEALDIRSNAYGASRSAPDALRIGQKAPAFTVPAAGGEALQFPLSEAQGPTVLIFYRGHW